MRYTVTKKFRDRLTGDIVEPGSIIDITKTRADEILSHGDYIKKTAVARKKKTEDKAD